MRKFISLFLTLAMVLSLGINVTAATVSAEFTNAEAAAILENAADFYNPGVTTDEILGELDGTAAPTIGGTYLMADRAFGEIPTPGNGWLLQAAGKPEFTDVPENLTAAIENLANARVILDEDGDGLLAPETALTKAEIETLIRRIYSAFGTNPKDDFHAAINHEYFRDVEVPAGLSSAGYMPEATRRAELQLAELLAKLAEGEYEQGTDEQKAADFYRAFMKLGDRDVSLYYFEKLFGLIDEAEDTEAIHTIYTSMIKQMGYDSFLGVGVTENFKGDGKNIYYLPLPKLTLHEAETAYNDPKVYAVANEYNVELLRLIGDGDPETHAAAVTAFEKQVQNSGLPQEDAYDPSKAYTVMSLKEIQEFAPVWDFSKIIKAYGEEPDLDRLGLVVDTGKYKEYLKIMEPENLELLKTILKLDIARQYKDYMGDDFRKAYIKFREESIGEKPLPKEDYYVQNATEQMNLLLQRLYVKYYVDPRTKAGAEEIAKGATATFLARMDTYTWLSEETREEAKDKLKKLKVIAAHPDDMSSGWDKIDISSDNDAFTIKKEFDKAAVLTSDSGYGGKPKVDFNIMLAMKTYEANAMFVPSYNIIYFPAGFLTAPFYDPDASLEENLGGFGAVAGHEISHAFDDSGAQYDSDGVVRNWWTDEDYEAFGARVDKIVKHYDGFEFAPGLMNNPTLTLGENIADIAGLSVILEYYKNTAETPDYAKFFAAYSTAWGDVRSRKRAEVLADYDVHSNYWLRVDRVVPLFEEFYEAFDIKPTDGMYIAPEKRVSIW
jgi:putative endopeptidase